MKTQKGRSLVEMLAVLALMALIGFSAFQGVDFVLRKNATTNIWKEILIRASAVRSQNKANQDLNLNIAGFDNDAYGLNWEIIEIKSASCKDTDAKIGIKISSLDEKIRDSLVDRARLERPKSMPCLYFIMGTDGTNLLRAGKEDDPALGKTLVFGFSKKTGR